MDKPTVFLSHSSKDSRSLKKLKKALEIKTANTIQFFLASDGQSIPFGSNWVSTLEKALDRTALMFLFLSKNSIESSWVNFEAGYSYSKGVRIIPVSVLGLKFDEIKPPLSLMQGFEIQNFNGLNNIISIINDKFGTSFQQDFSDNDYSQIFDTQRTMYNEYSFFNSIRYFYIILNIERKCRDIVVSDLCSLFDSTLNQSNHIVSFGVRVSVSSIIKNNIDITSIQIHLKPSFYTMYLDKLMQFSHKYNAELHVLNVIFDKQIVFTNNQLDISAKLYGSNIVILPEHFKCDNILFKLDTIYEQDGEKYNCIKLYHVQINEIKIIYDIVDSLFCFGVFSM